MQPGTYTARAVNAVLARTSKGNPQVAVEFMLLDEHVHGQRITWFGFFTDRTYERTIQSLRHCGWEGDDLSELGSVGSTDCRLDIGYEEYDGKQQLRVRWVNSLSGVVVQSPMTTDEAKLFAAEMRNRVRAVDISQPKKRQPQKAHDGSDERNPPGIKDDDLPF
jgi:hypothetical protein